MTNEEAEAMREQVAKHDEAVAAKAKADRKKEIKPIHSLINSEAFQTVMKEIDSLPEALDADKELGQLILVLRSSRRCFQDLGNYPSLTL